MAALQVDLTIEQGSTWAHGFRPTVDNEPILADGWTAKAQVRATQAGDVLHEWSTQLGNINIDTVNGNLTLTLDPDDSTPWVWRKAVYDIEVTSPDGATTRRIAQGKIRVSPEVTR
jgi:hypothetical protein